MILAEKALLRCRHWIESIFQTLAGRLPLERHGARRQAGLFTRIGQRLLALAAVIWHNTNIGAPNQDHSLRTVIGQHGFWLHRLVGTGVEPCGRVAAWKRVRVMLYGHLVFAEHRGSP
ncbi:hypothetical protein [Actinoplanes sp. NPDC049802]|uniref:hypothetical protein n=1 Tax=Actinoplanes sp. NPDC049802 TaxID=3154742 RepID=UPI0033F3493E